jgi:hypothetical protein
MREVTISDPCVACGRTIHYVLRPGKSDVCVSKPLPGHNPRNYVRWGDVEIFAR